MAEAKPEKINFPLKELFDHPCTKRARRAILRLRRYLAKKHKVSEDSVFISQKINETIFARGPQKIPRMLELQVISEENKVRAYLQSEKIEPKEKKKEEKKEQKKEPKEEKAKEKEAKIEKSEREQKKEDKIEQVEEKKMLEDKKEREKAAQRTAIKRRQDK
ncbi:MAG: hypothetical protein N3F05_00435 [Candidatus Diapherotrites archaeon]|nr:hypothetical protein [Candidatus Diapherotrites archaeon]